MTGELRVSSCDSVLPETPLKKLGILFLLKTFADLIWVYPTDINI